ncbi:sugar transferase [Oceanitalea stevensii]|uniref:Sugar transferase n=1 Tax=Oceanitalea stevensii TaxID=2763072 RepID=A0ABR8Z510_9MICO|nr:sugar transferase [Oceanitalea stevensii]MBD8063393.1 sugar transferase [Oceanitalea stevensii]
MALYEKFGKRVFDIVATTGALVAFAPVSAVIAIAIRAESPGGVLYTQTRIGRNGNPFKIYKFRTMLPLEQSFRPDGSPLDNAERVTRVGSVLRRLSIDEVPQLINVVKGDMSLVGPRPTLPYQVTRYTDEQRRRLGVRPGLTGLAQVSGRNSLTWTEKIEYDVKYVDNITFLGDLKIVVRTLNTVLRKEDTAFSRHDDLSVHERDYRDDIT